MFSFLFKKHAHAGKPVSIVFDVGGTKTRVAQATADSLSEVRIEPTQHDPKEGAVALTRLITEVAGTGRVTHLIGCVAGFVDERGVISGARNLGWDGLAIVTALEGAFAVAPRVFNDCELVGLGEATRGAGVGSKKLAYITVSTGVGGALIVDGQIVPSAGKTFEIGRINVADTDLESLVSGTAVRARFNTEPKELADEAIKAQLAGELAVGLTEVVRKWSPDRLVLGGSMIVGENAIPFDEIQKQTAELVKVAGIEMPEMQKAKLNDLGGLYGALVCAEQSSK